MAASYRISDRERKAKSRFICLTAKNNRLFLLIVCLIIFNIVFNLFLFAVKPVLAAELKRGGASPPA